MAYTEYYRLLAARKVRELIKPHLHEGMSLRRLWLNVMLPVWPVSYRTFTRLAGESNLDERISALEKEKATK